MGRKSNLFLEAIGSVIIYVAIVLLTAVSFQWCVDSIFGINSPFIPNLVFVVLFVNNYKK